MVRDLGSDGTADSEGMAVLERATDMDTHGKHGSGTPMKGLRFPRVYTRAGENPYDEVEWELRTAAITNENGKLVFEQKDVEFPKFWSSQATNVVASKYFRGQMGTPGRERSVKQLIGRVATTIAGWGRAQGYFASEMDAQAFEDELTYLLLHQKAAFNSPVWFNCGVEEKPQCSACFINSVGDTMEGILTLAKTEGLLFKWGSGTGTNFSSLRSSREHIQGGGTASGPVSFMKGFDAFAGVIKSGGRTRRAAKMVILNAEHPDIVEYIKCKAEEEKKAWTLIDSGYDPSLNGPAYSSIFFQNSNNSVRVTDEFMEGVEKDRPWTTKAVVTGKPVDTYRARDLMGMICEAAHQCGDPGLQFDTTINDWHTCPNTARINASNPCVTGDTMVATDEGWQRIDSLVGKTANVIGSDGLPHPVTKIFSTGVKQVFRLRTREGIELRVTDNHKILTERGDIAVKDLRAGDRVVVLGSELEFYADSAVSRMRARSFAVNEETSRLAVEMTQEAQFIEDRIVSIESVGEEPVFDLTEPVTHHFVANGIVVHNCSEYLFIDDSACNLASLNVMKFLREDKSFDTAGYKHAAATMLTAQEIIVDNASYPTPKIEENSHNFRPLGLGYANVGALLMSWGLPYDSDKGRAVVGALTALIHGEAYAQSARIAAQVTGPFPGYEKNREPMLRVIQKHWDAVDQIDARAVPKEIMDATRATWQECWDLGSKHGYRNSQVTVIAPTGTIAFMMDCDTTGVEPDIALVKYKKLAGGGMLKIVNNTVPEALRRLGYGEDAVDRIVRHIDERETIEGAPGLKDEHLPVFDCAFTPRNGTRSIHYMGHIRMMEAVQPFISGAISKTVNMPENATPQEVAEAYMAAWKGGLKAIAIYRDGSKRSQPLSTSKEDRGAQGMRKQPALELVSAGAPLPKRRRLPDERKSLTHKFSVAGHDGYITVGMYDDGSAGEIFIVMAKAGSTLSGVMDSFATAVSLGLQHGVPLELYVSKFAHVRFEPHGFTKNSDIPIAKSIVDYLFRWLGIKFLGHAPASATHEAAKDDPLESHGAQPVGDNQLSLINGVKNGHIEAPIEDTSFVSQTDAPPCTDCGAIMVRRGACYSCLNCGATSGCS